MNKTIYPIILLILFFLSATAQKKVKNNYALNKKIFSGLKFRNIGPAFMSGRIADIAIHPENHNIRYVAVGSGGVWKTENAGTTWKPVFDSQKPFSIGCVTIDPNNPHTVWVGTGENVGGRHVAWGDGIYKSTDDGKSWKNMGLKKSEHISEIIIHPTNSQIIWVAVQGPLWSKGGERGFYKSVDGGLTWKRTLGDDEWLGVTDIDIDSRNPDRLYAVTWERHRTIAAYMGGGFKTAIYRSEDGGDTWKKIMKGMPKGKKGKIGIAVSPIKPDVVYAAVELNRRTGAVYRSENRGETWVKKSNTVSGATGPHYYQELWASPHKFDRIYLANVRMLVSEDGGKTFKQMSEKNKHSDNHALEFIKDNPDYLLVGTDGGLYESFDNTKTWCFVDNLPLTQFYKLAVDDSKPFYWIYGGTQDNSTQAGPSRTDDRSGISNRDWEIVLFADGHQPAIEPGNPDIMYAEWQEGNLVRIDRTTGEIIHIQPQPGEGEPFERYNWDSPILVSPHSPTRLYYGSYRVWKSDSRGDDWIPISGDLTNFEERFDMPIMGKKQSWDSPWDVYAMSTFNTITSLAESPVKEGLIYAGTDDGLIQVTDDGGSNWRKIEVRTLPDAPDKAFVNDIKADLFDENTVYVCLDNHKFGDFQPLLYKSKNKGKRWKKITGDLPQTLIVWRLVQDETNPNLLFIGTEYGIYFTINGGKNWIKMNTGANISFRDLAIQRREHDLVGASFGRGIFILDDYTPLRYVSESNLQNEALLFPVKNTWWYIQRGKIGGGKKGSQGESFYTAPNPPFGATFTYYLKDNLKSLKQKRQEKEKKLEKENKDIEFPGWGNLDKELKQDKPKVFLTVLDSNNKMVKIVYGSEKKGIHRVNWNLRFASKNPIRLKENKKSGDNPFMNRGFMVAPGIYKVFLSKEIDGEISVLSDTVKFEVVPLRRGALKGANPEKTASFWKELSDFRSALQVLRMNFDKVKKKAFAMQKALKRADVFDTGLNKKIFLLKQDMLEIERKAFGSPSRNEVGEHNPPNISDRLRAVSSGVMNSTYGPTKMHKKTFEIAKREYARLYNIIKDIQNNRIPFLEKELKRIGAPYIEGETIEK